MAEVPEVQGSLACNVCGRLIDTKDIPQLNEHLRMHRACKCRWVGYNEDVISRPSCPEHRRKK